MTASPASTTSHSRTTPEASRTRRVASASSGPMPSPGISVTRWAIAAILSGRPGRTGLAVGWRLPGRRGATGRRSVRSAPSGHLSPDHLDRVVIAIGDPLLERDDGVVGDLDVLGADFGAALRDVAVADAAIVLEELEPIGLVDGVHLEARHADEEPRADELVLGAVVAEDVADVLAQEALDALAVLLDSLDVALLPPPLLLRRVRGRLEGRDPPVHLVVPRDVRDQVADERECPHRLDRDRVVRLEVGQPRLACERGPSVDLGAARAALRRLAVPADRQVRREVRLDPVEGVQDDHPLLHRHDELDELPGLARGAAKDAQAGLGHR